MVAQLSIYDIIGDFKHALRESGITFRTLHDLIDVDKNRLASATEMLVVMQDFLRVEFGGDDRLTLESTIKKHYPRGEITSTETEQLIHDYGMVPDFELVNARAHIRKLTIRPYNGAIGRVEFVQGILKSNKGNADALIHSEIQNIVNALVNPANGMIEFGDVQALIDGSFIPFAERGREAEVPEPDPSLMMLQDILLPLRTKLAQNQESGSGPKTAREVYQRCDADTNLLVHPREVLK
jgi:hypothetical protein